jgi:hypothetical protein
MPTEQLVNETLDFIINSIDKLNSYDNKKLKEFCKENGLKRSGNGYALRSRIMEYLLTKDELMIYGHTDFIETFKLFNNFKPIHRMCVMKNHEATSKIIENSKNNFIKDFKETLA